MKIQVSLSRLDILRTNLLLVYRVPSNWAFIAFIWIGYLGMYFFRRGFSEGVDKVLTEVLNGGVAAVIAFILLFSLTLFLQVFSATKKSGVLGEHTYIIEEDGLRKLQMQIMR